MFVFLFCNRQNGFDSAQCWQKNQPSTHKLTFMWAFCTMTQKCWFLYEISGTFNPIGHTSVLYTTQNNSILIRQPCLPTKSTLSTGWYASKNDSWDNTLHTFYILQSGIHISFRNWYAYRLHRSTHDHHISHVVCKALVVLRIPSARQSYAHQPYHFGGITHIIRTYSILMKLCMQQPS